MAAPVVEDCLRTAVPGPLVASLLFEGRGPGFVRAAPEDAPDGPLGVVTAPTGARGVPCGFTGFAGFVGFVGFVRVTGVVDVAGETWEEA